MIFKGPFQPKLVCDVWTLWIGEKRGLLGVLTVIKHESLCYLTFPPPPLSNGGKNEPYGTTVEYKQN